MVTAKLGDSPTGLPSSFNSISYIFLGYIFIPPIFPKLCFPMTGSVYFAPLDLCPLVIQTGTLELDFAY